MARARASWDEYFMNIATEVASRATCDRKHVGAVVVRDKSILATGYNGSVRGLGHCDDEGHLMEDGHCVRTVHAEANAIVQAARNGMRIEGASIYVRIVFGEFYRDQKIFDVSQKIGIELVDFSKSIEKATPA
jgi:dCMP deaminase